MKRDRIADWTEAAVKERRETLAQSAVAAAGKLQLFATQRRYADWP